MKFKLPAYDTCSFCQDLSGDRECAIIVRSESAFAEVDERQYEQGAMLVLSTGHRETILDLEDGEIEAVYRLVRHVAKAATAAFGALGMNVFQNNGSPAGQHEPHFHVHVVPRYQASDPHRRFLQRDYEAISIEEQLAIAAKIRAAL